MASLFFYSPPYKKRDGLAPSLFIIVLLLRRTAVRLYNGPIQKKETD